MDAKHLEYLLHHAGLLSCTATTVLCGGDDCSGASLSVLKKKMENQPAKNKTENKMLLYAANQFTDQMLTASAKTKKDAKKVITKG